MKKEELERRFVDMIIKKGNIKNYVVMQDGNHEYYWFELIDGEIRYWKDLSDKSLKRLGLLKEEGLCLR